MEKRLSIEIDPKLLVSAKMHALKSGVTLKKYITSLIKTDLKEKE